MARTDTSPESATTETAPATSEPGTPSVDGGEPASFAGLIRALADDTRTLVQQEIELVRMEAGRSARRLAVDTGWIWAGAVVVTVGLICLAVALALGLGALMGSYWLGALVTGLVFLVAGALVAWRGVRDLKAGGLLPSGPLQRLKEDRDWAQNELDELKKGITEAP